MKIDKSKLDALAALPDDKLWDEIVSIAASYGVTLPRAKPVPSELSKLRSALSAADKMNMLDAMRIVSKYKKGS